MDRRRFLGTSLGAGLVLGAGSLACAARADQQTCKRFHAALARDPTLAVYAGVVGI